MTHNIDTLEAYDDLIDSFQASLLLDHSLPPDLEDFRIRLLDNIAHTQTELEKEYSSIAYANRRATFVDLEKEIMSMGSKNNDK